MASLREKVTAASATHGLVVMGITADDGATRVLLGTGPRFWDGFQTAPEWLDGERDPIDRWSTRIMTHIAQETGARESVFPFGGPPYLPFISWAFATGETFSSPVGMLVHHKAGFWISFRGALVFDTEEAPNIQSATSPCPKCPRPCTTACPVGALTEGEDYDVAACKAHVSGPQGHDCRNGGCLVRRACPVSIAFGRDKAQSAFHMGYFLGG